MNRLSRNLGIVTVSVLLAACSGNGPLSGGKAKSKDFDPAEARTTAEFGKGKIWDLFRNKDDPNTTIRVNKYLWTAALDVLSFLPVESADPFSGVIVMGWGRAKGSSRTYRATVYIQDPALDARSLRVALMTRSGPASPDTVRAIENAILTRARQIRIADSKL